MWMGTTSCRQGPNERRRRRPYLMTKTYLILVLLVVAIHGGDDDDDYDCEEDSEAGLIEGGARAPLGRYPYNASIKFEGLHACGGVLISKKWLLTIQACAKKREDRVEQVTVVTGAFLDCGEELKVSKIVLEEDGDLALMELEEESSEQFVKVNRKSKVKGLILTLMGFGRQSGNDAFSQRLQEAIGLAVQDNQSCVEEFPEIQSSGVICVGSVSRACFGDEGSPLILPDPSNPTDPASDKLIGLAIFPTGKDECGENEPGFFVNVAKRHKWISSVIN